MTLKLDSFFKCLSFSRTLIFLDIRLKKHAKDYSEKSFLTKLLLVCGVVTSLRCPFPFRGGVRIVLQ